MMAYDSSQTPPSRLDDATLNAVRAALRSFLGNGHDAAVLQRALEQLSTDARAHGMLAEQVLVVLKDLWQALPEVRAVPDSAEQVRLLQRVVTMCIREYYRD